MNTRFTTMKDVGMIVPVVKMERAHAVADAVRGPRKLPDRPENSRPAFAEEHGTGAARRAHRAIPGVAVEDRARATVSHAAHAAADRHGIRRRPRALLPR